MSFEMADNHFMFLVTLPIHVEAMIVRRKMCLVRRKVRREVRRQPQ